MKNMQKGFTLIELMIVVVIIGILAAIAFPAYQDYVARSQISEAMVLAESQKEAVISVWSNTGVAPTNNPGAGLPDPTDISGKYVKSVTIGSDGTISAKMKGTGVAPGISDASLTLNPIFPAIDSTGGAVGWRCTSSAANKYLPAACRQ